MFYIILESSNDFVQGILNQSLIMLKYVCKTTQSMNKLTIPSILAATVLIAGIFAFMPVEKASTVHTGLGNTLTSIQTQVGELEADVGLGTNLKTLVVDDDDLAAGDMYMLECNKEYTVIGIMANVAGTLETTDGLVVSLEGVTLDTATGFDTTQVQSLHENNIPLPANGEVVLTATEGTDDGDEETDVMISVLTSNNATCEFEETAP